MFERYRAALALLYAEGGTASDCRRIAIDPEELFEALETESGRERVSRLLGKTIGPVRRDAFDAQVATIERTGAQAVCLWDDAYPDYLHHVAQPPPVLFYRGSLDPVRRRGVAIVGTRKPTPAGAAMARSLGRELSAMGIPIVSGLARGIDSAAHEGGVSARGGSVAVVGTGLDIPYPPENAELLLEVADNGCAVSEQPMGTRPHAFVFPLRNRLISAMSHAVVVVEGGERSGALITAKWALEQGRDVGAVPGFPGDFRSRGVNRLLKQGAFLVENAADVITSVPRIGSVYGLDPAGLQDTTAAAADRRLSRSALATDAENRLLSLLSRSPVDVDALARHAGVEVSAVHRTLFHLEMAGRVERDSIGRYTRID
jgi:DNA processing protein